uniref:Uncharacterized protein n=1 Tax=Parascaris equorum TaxID=6256 RepID=A0A914RA20_PAREQ
MCRTNRHGKMRLLHFWLKLETNEARNAYVDGRRHHEVVVEAKAVLEGVRGVSYHLESAGAGVVRVMHAQDLVHLKEFEDIVVVWEGLPEEVDRRSSKDLTKAAPSDDDVDRILAKRAKVDQERPRDPKEDMRKLLGLLVTMQQEVQQRGQLDDATISRLYEEVGVSGGDMTSSGALLQQLCQMLVGDGIAPVKEQTTEASFVYPGAPDPEVQEAPTIHAPYTGYGGIGESVLRESPQVATINPWMNGAS